MRRPCSSSLSYWERDSRSMKGCGGGMKGEGGVKCRQRGATAQGLGWKNVGWGAAQSQGRRGSILVRVELSQAALPVWGCNGLVGGLGAG